MSEWISVEDRLPELEYERGGAVNGVIALYKDGKEPCGGFRQQVVNAAWLIKNGQSSITHWMPLPEPPQ